MARTYTNSLAEVTPSYPGAVFQPLERLNKSDSYAVRVEAFTVPSVADSEGRYRVELDYAIRSQVTPVIACGATADMQRIPYPSVPGAGEVGVSVDDVPILEFNATRAGESGTITYHPLASVRTSDWENRIQKEIAAVQQAVDDGGGGGGGGVAGFSREFYIGGTPEAGVKVGSLWVPGLGDSARTVTHLSLSAGVTFGLAGSGVTEIYVTDQATATGGVSVSLPVTGTTDWAVATVSLAVDTSVGGGKKLNVFCVTSAGHGNMNLGLVIE